MHQETTQHSLDREVVKTQVARLLVEACMEPLQAENAALLGFLVTVGVTANTFLRSVKSDSSHDKT